MFRSFWRKNLNFEIFKFYWILILFLWFLEFLISLSNQFIEPSLIFSESNLLKLASFSCFLSTPSFDNIRSLPSERPSPSRKNFEITFLMISQLFSYLASLSRWVFKNGQDWSNFGIKPLWGAERLRAQVE